MNPMNPYVEAARPKTLFNALAPVIVGTAVGVFGTIQAYAPITFSEQVPFAMALESWIFLFGCALVIALAATIAVNYANDLFDGLAGNDGEARTGPRRAVAAGLLTPRQMAIAFGIALAVFIGTGLMVLWITQAWVLLPVGIGCAVLLYCYSGGPYPLASHGLGEVAVFLTFGMAATVGTAYLIGSPAIIAVPYAIGIGSFSCAVLEANNIRDIPEDSLTNKRTLAVRLGDTDARQLYRSLMLVPYLVTVLACFHVGAIMGTHGMTWMGVLPALSLVSFPLAISAIRKVLSGASGADLVALIPVTGMVMTLWALGIAAGLGIPAGVLASQLSP